MKILYVGESYVGAIAAERRKILEDLGHRVLAVNSRHSWSRLHPLRLLYRASVILQYPLDLLGINRKLAALSVSQDPDLVWIDKGLNIYPATIRKIKARHPGITVVNFNPDNPFVPASRGWGWFKRCIPLYDFCLVPRQVSVAEYFQAGARRVSRFYWGYLPRLHRPVPVSGRDRQELGGGVGFIGTYEKPRGRLICHLVRAGVPVRVWGNDWTGLQSRPPNLRIEGRPVWDTQFVRAICSFKINLGFLNRQNRDTLNTRCLAIPACGGFLLAERTGDLPDLFREGVEAEFFADGAELADKAKFYLTRPAARLRIAAAGRQRCLTGGYSFENRMQEILHTIRSGGLTGIAAVGAAGAHPYRNLSSQVKEACQP
jgi:spore maturation protein CgeB